ncbi:MAG: 5-methylcytosine-specific restriction enzyme [Acidobacteriota bacterium]|jgi:hypothetical protein|nr:5-methylcytosine-specific restriction enzyme [Acidobacteriota bacterium]
MVAKTRTTDIVPTFNPGLTDRRTKLPKWLVEKFQAGYRQPLYFYREHDAIVVTTSTPQKENLLFSIRVSKDKRPRLSEVELRKIGATFGDELEFDFIGRGKAIVRILRQESNDREQKNIPPLPEEVEDSRKYVEGATRQVTINAFERNQKARQACINHFGLNCYVCSFNFEEFYGDMGKDFINVHHLKPISSVGEEYELDPIKDLRPVCPNCHAMIHSKRPPYTIEEVQRRLKYKFAAIR